MKSNRIKKTLYLSGMRPALPYWNAVSSFFFFFLSVWVATINGYQYSGTNITGQRLVDLNKIKATNLTRGYSSNSRYYNPVSSYNYNESSFTVNYYSKLIQTLNLVLSYPLKIKICICYWRLNKLHWPTTQLVVVSCSSSVFIKQIVCIRCLSVFTTFSKNYSFKHRIL